MGRDTSAAALTVITQPVILADDLVAVDVTETQRGSAVVADIASGRHRAVRDAVDHDTLVQQPRGKGLMGHFMGVGYGIPEGGKRSPVRLGEGAVPRQSSCQAGSLKIRGRNKGSRRRHGPLWTQRSTRINRRCQTLSCSSTYFPMICATSSSRLLSSSVTAAGSWLSMSISPMTLPWA